MVARDKELFLSLGWSEADSHSRLRRESIVSSKITYSKKTPNSRITSTGYSQDVCIFMCKLEEEARKIEELDVSSPSGSLEVVHLTTFRSWK